jgi:hypothetical protein
MTGSAINIEGRYIYGHGVSVLTMDALEIPGVLSREDTPPVAVRPPARSVSVESVESPA